MLLTRLTIVLLFLVTKTTAEQNVCKPEHRAEFYFTDDADNSKFPRAEVQLELKSDWSRTLERISLCFFVRADNRGRKQLTALSYNATADSANDFKLVLCPNIQVYLNNTVWNTSVEIDYGNWSHICFMWQKSNGNAKLYKNGKFAEKNNNFKEDYELQRNGTVVLGQHRGEHGGFLADERFIGELSQVNLWDVLLSKEEARAQTRSCEIPHGSMLSWPEFYRRENLKDGLEAFKD